MSDILTKNFETEEVAFAVLESQGFYRCSPTGTLFYHTDGRRCVVRKRRGTRLFYIDMRK